MFQLTQLQSRPPLPGVQPCAGSVVPFKQVSAAHGACCRQAWRQNTASTASSQPVQAAQVVLCRQLPGRVPSGRACRRSIAAAAATRGSSSVEAAEAAVLEALADVKGRGSQGLPPEQLQAFEEAVKVLEADGGVKAPTASEQLDGRWRLLYTSKPGTASPIQRTFTGVDAFSILQDITLRDVELPTINNVVEFGKTGVLRVVAEANTDSRPLPGFVPRKGAGLRLFGKSRTYPPAGPDIRIDFQFSKGAFDFSFLPFTIPYPVPFKALGDETKGFIDVTYMSERPDGLRLSRGNKGTLFVLQKEGPVPSPAKSR